MMNTTVSVIVPTYNGEKTLSKTVESLVNQSLKGIEIILADDCSSDNTPALIEEYCKKNPDLITSNPMAVNTRGSGVINRSVELAKGKYVAIVDQDDWVDRTMFEKLYNAAEKEQAEIADCFMAVVDSFGNLMRIDQSNSDEQIGVIDTMRRKSLFVFPGRRLTKIFRRDFLLEHEIEHCDGICYGDNFFMEHVAAYCNIIVKVKEPLYYYRVDTTSTTRSYNNPILYDRVKSSELMIESLDKRGFLTDEFREEIEFRFIELFYINSIDVFMGRFDPPEVSELTYLRDKVKKEYPLYRKNPYFKQRISKKNKLKTFLNDLNPSLLCEMHKIRMKLK